MNKKILSIFALIMAISILGVSCAENPNNPNNNGGSTPPLAQDKADAAIQALATVTSDTVSFDFSQKTATASGADYTVTVESATASKSPKISDIITDLGTTKKGDVEAAGGITINDITYTLSTDSKTFTATIAYTTSDKKNGKFIITFKLTGNSTFAKAEINLAAITGAFDALATVDVDGGAEKTKDNVTFNSTAISTGKFTVNPADGTGTTDTKIDLALIDQVVTKINTALSIEGATVTAEGPADAPTDQNAATITVTITVDNAHDFATDVTSGTGLSNDNGVITIKVEITPSGSDNWDTAA